MNITNDNIDQLLNLYSKEESITAAAKEFCTENNIEYNDNLRRKISRLLNRYWDSNNISALTRNTTPAKILIFDIETMPMEAYIWSIWQKDVGLHMLKNDWYMLSWSAKWLFEEEIISDVLTPQEVRREDDVRITKRLWHLFDEADIVIAHNGKKFDIKRVNTRFLKHNLYPPSPYLLIDTLLTVRKKFAITSNKLDYIASQFFGFDGKIDTGGFELWKECKNGNKEALEKMRIYNIQDIKVLEEVYLRIRPWIQPHPNVNLYISQDVSSCSVCGGEDLEENGEYCTYATAYKAYRCNHCGAVNRSRKALVTSKNKQNMLYTVAK